MPWRSNLGNCVSEQVGLAGRVLWSLRRLAVVSDDEFWPARRSPTVLFRFTAFGAPRVTAGYRLMIIRRNAFASPLEEPTFARVRYRVDGSDNEGRFAGREASLERRLLKLAGCFALDLYAYVFRPNELDLLVYVDPGAPHRWSQREVAYRWRVAFPEPAKPPPIDIRRTALGVLEFFANAVDSSPEVAVDGVEDGSSRASEVIAQVLNGEDAVEDALIEIDFGSRDLSSREFIDELEHCSLAKRLTMSYENAELDAKVPPIVSGLIDGPTPQNVPNVVRSMRPSDADIVH